MPSKMNEPEARPTLPSIHTLNLPLLASPTSANVKYQNHDNSRWTPSHPPHNKPHHHDRQVSTSSSNTSSSRNSSPSPSDSEIPPSRTKFRLVPCPLETADAAIVVSPPGTPYYPYTPNYVPRAGKPEGFLCMGPVALSQLRSPRRAHPKGFRIHPYKIVRGPTTSPRRTSVISIISNPV